jgi:Homing endonuclease associated repeat/HNH endonuclease
MVFDLAPDNRDQPDAVLLDDLRSASARLGGRKLSREAYSQVGRFSTSTIAGRFGGWGKALIKAGLLPPRHFSVSRDECITDLRRVAAGLSSDIVTVALYRRLGQYSEKPFKRHFGGWPEALTAAGLKTSDQYHPRTTDEDLLENLEAVWQRLGRQPTVNDMFAPHSRFSADTYKRRFGGFRKALEVFVSAAGDASHGRSALDTASGSEVSDPPQGPRSKGGVRTGNRSVGWRLRYLVLERDRFSCRACGRSPRTEPATVLHVDHVTAWVQGGLTVEANLQTLCERCNIGKGAR